MSEGPEIEQRWYWDHRTNKAYYPKQIGDDGTVELVTTWHQEEVVDALETGALTPVEDLTLEYRSNVGFACFDSFRFDAVEEDPDLGTEDSDD